MGNAQEGVFPSLTPPSFTHCLSAGQIILFSSLAFVSQPLANSGICG